MDNSSIKHHVTARPSSLACVECRKTHLKCDAISPTCSRCSKQGLLCSYTPSRRGQRTNSSKRANKPFGHWNASPIGSNRQTGGRMPALPPPMNMRGHGHSTNSPKPFSGQIEYNTNFSTSMSAAKVWESQQIQADESTKAAFASFEDDVHLVNLFYAHFHPVHPFLLPQNHYRTSGYPKHLRLAIQFAGSHHASGTPNSVLSDGVNAIFSQLEDDAVALVQTFLLLTLVFHAQLDFERGQMALSRACAIAMRLGLDREGSLSLTGSHDPLVKESFRRTWWELYIIEGFCTALHRQPMLPPEQLDLSTPLPCHDSSYLEAQVPSSVSTLVQFDQRLFSNTEHEFSSGAYRIEAIRILRRAIKVTTTKDGTASSEIKAVDNALSVWSSHLPQNKIEAIDEYGRVDQMMLQAHSFIRFTQILIHFPRSELLNKILPAAKVACMRNVEWTSPTSAQHGHKAITAANEIADLAALPTRTYSPLFICSLVFASIVQLSACSAHSHTCQVEHRERLALMTGVLKKIARSWFLAQSVLHHLNNIASIVFGPREPPASAESQTPLNSDSGFETASITDTFAWLDQTFALDVDASINEEWMATA